MAYEIEDVAVTPDRPGRKAKYPFAMLKPGQSIMVRPDEAAAAASAAYAWRKRHGVALTCAHQADGSVRIGRTA